MHEENTCDWSVVSKRTVLTIDETREIKKGGAGCVGKQ